MCKKFSKSLSFPSHWRSALKNATVPSRSSTKPVISIFKDYGESFLGVLVVMHLALSKESTTRWSGWQLLLTKTPYYLVYLFGIGVDITRDTASPVLLINHVSVA